MSEYSLTNCVPVASSNVKWSKDAEYLVEVHRFNRKDPSKIIKRKNNGWTKAQRGKKVEENKVDMGQKWVERGLGRYFVETVHQRRKRVPEHAFDEVLITEERIPGIFKKVEEIALEVECPKHGVKYVCEFFERE